MPVLQVLKVAVAVVFSALGFVGLYLMFNAETLTANNPHEYFRWALGAGLVFVAIGAALTALDKEDNVVTKSEADRS